MPGKFSSRFSSNDVIFGSHDHHVYCLNRINGHLVWRIKLASPVYSTPFLFRYERLTLSTNKRIGIGSSQEPIRKCVRSCDEVAKPVEDLVTKDEKIIQIHHQNCDQSSLDCNIFKTTQSESCMSTCCDSDTDSVNTSQKRKLRPKSDLVRCKGSSQSPSYYVAVSCTSGVLAILDLTTGSIVRSYMLAGEVFSSPVVDDGKIIVGCRDDYIYRIDCRVSR